MKDDGNYGSDSGFQGQGYSNFQGGRDFNDFNNQMMGSDVYGSYSSNKTSMRGGRGGGGGGPMRSFGQGNRGGAGRPAPYGK